MFRKLKTLFKIINKVVAIVNIEVVFTNFGQTFARKVGFKEKVWQSIVIHSFVFER